MGVLSDLGSTFGVGGFDFSLIINRIYTFVGMILLAIILGAVLGGMFYIKKRKDKNKELAQVGWWQEIQGRPVPDRMDKVEEIVIPGTMLRVFYCKKRDLWLPRFTRGITKDLYYVLLTPTKQMVNFVLKGISSDLKEAGLEYDHTDMLWAAENTREYIKKNYKDKSVKWWQLYQNTIATAALILIMTFCFIIIIYFMRGIVQDLSGVVSQIGSWAKDACINSQTSGVLSAG